MLIGSLVRRPSSSDNKLWKIEDITFTCDEPNDTMVKLSSPNEVVEIATDSCVLFVGTQLEELLDLAIESAKADCCTISLPIQLLIDTWDLKSLEECELLFHLVEDRVDVWKSDLFYRSIKNTLLRTCNDLLRRLSKSQNTVFCGRILVFLARFFPLFERSGLNIIGEFNKDNVISVSLDLDVQPASTSTQLPQEELEEGEEGEEKPMEPKPPEGSQEPKSTQVVIDDALYLKFWQLQEFFRSPQSCYEKLQWKKFQSYSTDVLNALLSLKLDQSSNSELKHGESGQTFFAKFLTSQKLLELQLSDSNFRRYVLIQFLVLFQYLQQTVKFKAESQVLTNDQQDFVSEFTTKVYELIAQTSPNGSEFARTVRQILRREECWNRWKNENCHEVTPDDVKPKPRISLDDEELTAGDNIKNTESDGRHTLGNKELTRLWNLCPDNWEACRSRKRIFTPTIEDFFDDIVHQSKDKRVRTISGDPNFTWRALRLLSQKSPYFFAHSNNPVKTVYQYMEGAIDKLAEVLVKDKQKNFETPVTTPAIDEDAEDVSDEEFLKMPQDHDGSSRDGRGTSASPSHDQKNEDLVTKSMIKDLAKKIAPKWKSIASKFTFTSDEVEYWESECPNSSADAAEKMLLIWVEQFVDDATVSKLRDVCRKYNIDID